MLVTLVIVGADEALAFEVQNDVLRGFLGTQGCAVSMTTSASVGAS